MSVKQLEFGQRVDRLARKHQKMERGYRAQMRADGLVVMRPQRVRSAVPMRVLVLFFCGFFAFKAFLLATLGTASYDERVDRLKEGTLVEQAGAFVMQSEPVSVFLASKLTGIIR